MPRKFASVPKNLKAIHNDPYLPGISPPSCVRRTKIKNLKAIHNSSRFNMSGCIPYRRRPPPVRNMRAVLKKASYGTRRVFRSSPCSKQASGVQKGYSVPETPFSGTEQAMYGERPPDVPTEAEERGSGSEIGDFAKNGHLYAPVTAAKQSQSAMDYLELPLNSCRQLWAATKPLQTATKSQPSRCK